MARLQRWLKTLVAGDQFGASGRAHAEHALRQAEEALGTPGRRGAFMIGSVRLSIGAFLVGVVVVITPAAIEIEEVIRQAVPAREGRPDASFGNLVGTVLYFVLFNLGLIATAAPVHVSALTRTLDWPFLVASVWLATLFFWRGGISRTQGVLLLAVYPVYIAAHLVLR